jgi:hypothetical protein
MVKTMTYRLRLILPVLLSAAAIKSQEMPAAYKYVGPGSCAASACHGSVKPLSTSRVLQNEYSIWVTQDPHARAYRSLQNNVSQRMGKILGIGDPAQSQKCLACHALSVQPSRKGREFDVADGVSCESCHGPASQWLGPHTLATSTHEQNVHNGMMDLRNLQHRAELCLTCHLGTGEKQVDHEMIAAGHPDLTFELDSFSATMPPHWKSDRNPNFGVRDWSIGQAVDLRETLNRVARHASSGEWPEYADLDCFACHHSLTTAENSWRQARGYAGHQTGAPPFNNAHYAVFTVLAEEIDPSGAKELDSAMEAVYKDVSKYHSNPQQVSASAEHAAQIAEEFVSKTSSAQYSQALTARMLHALSEQGPRLADDDTRTAEQTAMAIDSLYISYSKSAGESASVRESIDGLFKLLQNPSGYNAPQFRAQMERVRSELSAAGIR